jgi:hypothetical protein
LRGSVCDVSIAVRTEQRKKRNLSEEPPMEIFKKCATDLPAAMHGIISDL